MTCVAANQYPTPPPSPPVTDQATLGDDHHECIHLTPPPIPFSLGSEHPLPHIATLTLASPKGILNTLGNNRTLRIQETKSFWDRMPYSAASTATMPASMVQLEEKQVEKLLGGQTPVQRQSGVHWSLGSSSK